MWEQCNCLKHALLANMSVQNIAVYEQSRIWMVYFSAHCACDVPLEEWCWWGRVEGKSKVEVWLLIVL